MSGMKKFFGIGLLALLTTAYLTSSCSRDEFSGSMIDAKKATFNDNFIAEYGNIAPNHDWGFGTNNGTRAFTRSVSNPTVLDIDQPYDETWVADYLTTAKEPTSENTWDNYDNSSYAINYGEGGVNSIDRNDPQQVSEREYFFSLSWEQQIAWALANHPTWISYNADETFVRNFKITGTYDGYINVAGSEGYLSDHVTRSNAERTIVVTGTWNITADQRIGEFGKIIIANGGTVNVSSGKMLNMVNQARLVVLPGGKLTGEGSVAVNNGNAAGLENYNGGTIDVAVFNNNFGKFYNHGKFMVNEYQGGAQESNFYNHALVSVDHFGGSTANARIFNGCQFYVRHDARIRNYEGIRNSSLVVDGQLMFSSSEDGTSTPTYVALAAQALVQAGSLYNNGTSWTGPTSEYAVLSIGQFDYLNWEQEHPELGGYFINNIYVQCDTWDNIPDGNGMAGETADKKFENVKNAGGNGNVTIVNKGDNEVIPADPDYVKGNVKQGTTVGCTPGFSISEEPDDTPPSTEIVLLQSGRVFCEDLGSVSSSDIDYNDVVFDAWIYVNANTGAFHCAFIQLLAAGGTIPIQVAGENVHEKFGAEMDEMVNTYRVDASRRGSAKHAEYGVDSRISFPAKIVITDANMVTDVYGNINIRNIPITVRTSNNTAIELNNYNNAEGGSEAPLKFMAPLGTKWPAEWIRFGDAYERFSAWVQNPVDEPWAYPNDFYTYDGSMPAVSTYAPTDAEIAAASASSSTGGNNGNNNGGGSGDDGAPSFGTLTGSEIYVNTTPLSSNSSLTVGVSDISNTPAATVYVYGTGEGSVYVNGVEATTVATRAAAGVVKSCTLTPKQMGLGGLSITGGNFTVYRLSYQATTLPTVSQPAGTVLFGGNGQSKNMANWGINQFSVAGSSLSGLTDKTKIRVAGIGFEQGNDSWQVQIAGNPWTVIGTQTYWTKGNTDGAVTVEFELTQDQATALLSGGLIVQGINFIMKYVTVENPSSTGGDKSATSTITLITNSIDNNGGIVTDQSTARGYVKRIVAGTTRLVGKVRINANRDNNESWYFQIGPSNSGAGIVDQVSNNSTSVWAKNDVMDINVLIDTALRNKLVDAVSNDYYFPAFMTFQGNNVTLTELKFTNCLAAE